MYSVEKKRLYPSARLEEAIYRNLIAYAERYNDVLRLTRYKHFPKDISALDIRNLVYKGTYPFDSIDSTVLMNADINAINDVNKYRKGKVKVFPKSKNIMKLRKTYLTYINPKLLLFKKGKIYLTKVGYIKTAGGQKIPIKQFTGHVRVELTSTNKYYAHLLIKRPEVREKVIAKKFIGLDFCIDNIYVDSEGNKAGYLDLSHLEERLAIEKFKLSRKVKGSKNYFKQLVKVNKIEEKIKNKRLDRLHKLSDTLTDEFDCIAVENIDIKWIVDKVEDKKKVYNDGYGKLVEMLKYKTRIKGKHLIVVDKYFPSSQLCSNCGFKQIGLKNVRIKKWTCVLCNRTHDRDINAAINIREEGRRIYNKIQEQKKKTLLPPQFKICD